MSLTTLTWGTIPNDLTLDEPYWLRCCQADLTTIAKIVNQGIDSHLEAVFCEQHGREITIKDSASMKTLLRRCVESNDENAQDLASGIMSTLGYEWV